MLVSWLVSSLISPIALFLYASTPAQVVTRTEQLSLKKGQAEQDENGNKKKGKKPKKTSKKGKGRKNKKGKKSASKIPAASSAGADKSEVGRKRKGKTAKLETEVKDSKKPVVEVPKPAVEVPKAKKGRGSVDGVPKTFARRYCPETGIGMHKWKGIVGAFMEHVAPELAAGTKTKAEVDFWRFAVQAHKDKGSPDDEKKLKVLFCEAAHEFLQLLNSVPWPP